MYPLRPLDDQLSRLSPAEAIEQCLDIHAIAIASFVRDNSAPMIVTGQTDFAYRGQSSIFKIITIIVCPWATPSVASR